MVCEHYVRLVTYERSGHYVIYQAKTFVVFVRAQVSYANDHVLSAFCVTLYVGETMRGVSSSRIVNALVSLKNTGTMYFMLRTTTNRTRSHAYARRLLTGTTMNFFGMNRERTEVPGVYALLGGGSVDDWHAWPSLVQTQTPKLV
jgi:hypothetical protein